eukprot:TRINITY_DN71017_c0_g1_i1.p2 TRINITY_DN71017_c0_g1~~TRINITY_DN71017_c0_g1_i1.p2  ORF type:complete len:137 (-),score=19.51 TRINITY_DN71017_c0_g1_i1:201-569(-)
MGENLSCSTQCAPNCISRSHPPGADGMEDQPLRRNVGRTYPVADPVDVHLNWQTIAVRHAWKRAAELGDTAEGPIDAAYLEGRRKEAVPPAAPFAAPDQASHAKAGMNEAVTDMQGCEVVKI